MGICCIEENEEQDGEKGVVCGVRFVCLLKKVVYLWFSPTQHGSYQ